MSETSLLTQDTVYSLTNGQHMWGNLDEAIASLPYHFSSRDIVSQIPHEEDAEDPRMDR